MQGESSAVSLGPNISVLEEQLKFQEAEIAKKSSIHDALLERENTKQR
jgi:hypothetical protein